MIRRVYALGLPGYLPRYDEHNHLGTQEPQGINASTLDENLHFGVQIVILSCLQFRAEWYYSKKHPRMEYESIDPCSTDKLETHPTR